MDDERLVVPTALAVTDDVVASPFDLGAELRDVTPDEIAPRARILGVQRRWVVNRSATNEPSALLKEIVVVGDEMQLRFRYARRDSSGTSIYATPPRHNDSMFIQHRNGSQRVYALRSEGIATHPKETWVERGKYLDYVVFFPPIDASWGPIAISEGNALFCTSKARYWFWKRVELVSP